LQNNLSQSLLIYFYAFDLLNENGKLLVNLPLSSRREALESLLAAPKDPLRLSPLLQASSDEVLEAVRSLRLEGVVGKRIDSTYESGERSGAWIKLRTNMEQEFVIGGYIPGARGFDALLVGVYEKKQLLFVAKVKNGFVPRIRDEIFPALKKQRVVHCPFKNLPEKRASRWGEALTAEKMKECYWVTPKLVCQIAFVEWTDAGHLRHCTFVGMRDDKKPAGVVRETDGLWVDPSRIR
jgi:bifunctional non-homologous end joining protein LigD